MASSRFPLCLQDLHQFFQEPEIRPLQALPLGLDPVLVAAGQQVPGIKSEGFFQSLAVGSLVLAGPGEIGLGDCVFKIDQVQLKGGIQLPGDRALIDLQVIVRLGQGFAQAVDQGP